MPLATRLSALLAVVVMSGACRLFSPQPPPAAAEALPPGALLPTRNLLVGRVLAVDGPRGYVFVDLSSEAPPAALAEGAELVARTDDLKETARLRAARYVRGRTLSAKIVSGQPTPGDEVVFLAP
jgi:hypothetical protein